MSLSYALLGFLNYAPMTGYDLKKILDDSISFFWSAQTSQIYRELKMLEEEGYISSAVKPSSKGPDKRLYSITETGVLHLKDWLADVRIDERMRNEFLVWVFFSSQIAVDDLYFQIQRKLKDYQKEYQMLKIVENKIEDYAQMFGKREEAFYWKIVLKRGLFDVEAKIRWAEDTLDYLEIKREDKR